MIYRSKVQKNMVVAIHGKYSWVGSFKMSKLDPGIKAMLDRDWILLSPYESLEWED